MVAFPFFFVLVICTIWRLFAAPWPSPLNARRGPAGFGRNFLRTNPLAFRASRSLLEEKT